MMIGREIDQADIGSIERASARCAGVIPRLANRNFASIIMTVLGSPASAAIIRLVSNAPMKTLFRVGAWLLLPRSPAHSGSTGLSTRHSTAAQWQHLGIFLSVGLAFGLGYETCSLLQASGLVLFSAVVEIVP